VLSPGIKKLMATSLVPAVLALGAPALAVPPAATATLTGTVFGESIKKPIPGATVIVTDANGSKLSSQPTAANGTFMVSGVVPGRQRLAIETKDGAFAIATPITLAPGETKGVHLALKAAGDSDDDKTKPASGWTGGAKAAMIAVIVGFAAAGAVGINNAGDDESAPASAYEPPE
jgi:Carboxypeptidase regulatory-like domain